MFLINKDKKLTPELIMKYINSFTFNTYPQLIKWDNYFKGKHKILQKSYADETKQCNRIVTNFCKVITQTYAGYIVGKPISYTSNDDIQDIQNVINYNDSGAEDMEFLINALTYGVAFELHYVDEDAQERFAQVNPLSAFAIYSNDLNRDLVYFVRWYPLDEITESTDYILEVYSSFDITRYVMHGINGGLEFISSTPHYFKDVPVSVFQLNTDEISVFDSVISLNDAFNELQSSEIDDYTAWVDSYLCLTNTDADENDIVNMKQNRTIVLPKDATAQWLTKDASDTQIQNMLENIKKNIYKITSCPDMADENFLAQSGTALAYKLTGFENTASAIVANMTKAIQRRIELICNILNLKATDAIWRDIEIQFTRNLPVNLTEIMQMVQALKGTVSDATLLSLLPFIKDPKAELEAVKAQKEENASLYGFNTDDADSSNE